MIKKSLLIWLAIIPLAIVNGGLRDAVIAPLLGAEYALPISAISLCLLVFILCYFSLPRIGKGTAKKYWTIGLLWVALTVAFEFGFGMLMGDTFAALLKAYDITTGNLWLVVVLFIGVSPYLTAKTRKLL